MKKLIAAIVIASVGASFAEDATLSTLVYEYRASIKRLDLKVAAKKVSKVNWYANKFNVVSDTIRGYVVLPKCQTCVAEDEPAAITTLDGLVVKEFDASEDALEVTTTETLTTPDEALRFQGYAYLTLSGNKFAKFGALHDDFFVMKTQAAAKAAVFGSESFLDPLAPVDPGQPVNAKLNTKAWMALDFAMHADELDAAVAAGELVPALKNDAQTFPLGFLGAGNLGAPNEMTVRNTGFGTAKVWNEKTAPTGGLCSSIPGSEFSCTMVNTINGTLVGYPCYALPCDSAAMWDVCVTEDALTGDIVYVPTGDAVICGSWSLKLNTALSKVIDQLKEDAILKKLNAKATNLNLYQVRYDGTIVDDADVDDDVLWTTDEATEGEELP